MINIVFLKKKNKMEKYFCDKCGKEIGIEHNFMRLNKKSNLDIYGDRYILCDECFKKVEEMVKK
jgi:DNA-directed RNA polymerase subunit RPC12/RpoP